MTDTSSQEPGDDGQPRSLSALDHFAQDAFELYAVALLQELARRRGVSHPSSEPLTRADVERQLAKNGQTFESLETVARARAYLNNLERGLPDFFERLMRTYPEHTFSFRFVGTQGRLERRKGDFEIDIHPNVGTEPTRRSVSLKNYERGVDRIQVRSGTFQSWALWFFLEDDGIGKWKNPKDASTCSVRSKSFREWRDEALRSNGHRAVVEDFRELDELNTSMRAQFLDSDDFLFYDDECVPAEQLRVGTEGALTLHRILSTLPNEALRDKFLAVSGLGGTEDLLVIGGGKIADTVTDPQFEALITSARQADLALSASGQTLKFAFVDAAGPVLNIAVPCTINTNGAWFRDEPAYDGTRYHGKEGVDLAWGQRRPKKSGEIATSINTYVELGKTGVLRSLPG